MKKLLGCFFTAVLFITITLGLVACNRFSENTLFKNIKLPKNCKLIWEKGETNERIIFTKIDNECTFSILKKTDSSIIKDIHYCPTDSGYDILVNTGAGFSKQKSLTLEEAQDEFEKNYLKTFFKPDANISLPLLESITISGKNVEINKLVSTNENCGTTYLVHTQYDIICKKESCSETLTLVELNPEASPYAFSHK